MPYSFLRFFHHLGECHLSSLCLSLLLLLFLSRSLFPSSCGFRRRRRCPPARPTGTTRHDADARLLVCLLLLAAAAPAAGWLLTRHTPHRYTVAGWLLFFGFGFGFWCGCGWVLWGGNSPHTPHTTHVYAHTHTRNRSIYHTYISHIQQHTTTTISPPPFPPKRPTVAFGLCCVFYLGGSVVRAGFSLSLSVSLCVLLPSSPRSQNAKTQNGLGLSLSFYENIPSPVNARTHIRMYIYRTSPLLLLLPLYHFRFHLFAACALSSHTQTDSSIDRSINPSTHA